MEPWHVGVDPWIIQDGNYADFRCGQVADFALAFRAPHGLRLTEHQEPRAEHGDEDTYRIVAKVVYSMGTDIVLDFGTRAYTENGERFPKGTMVEGELSIGIDPFVYYDRLFKHPHMPALIYRWRIDRILRVSAPLVDGKGPDGRPTLVWDETRKTTEEVDRTDAWGDESEYGASGFWYVLVCTRTGLKAWRTRRRATASHSRADR